MTWTARQAALEDSSAGLLILTTTKRMSFVTLKFIMVGGSVAVLAKAGHDVIVLEMNDRLEKVCVVCFPQWRACALTSSL